MNVKKKILLVLLVLFAFGGAAFAQSPADTTGVSLDFGMNFLEEDIDNIIMRTNEFLTDSTHSGSQGPFWWILQMAMALGALFAIIMAGGMAFKMMTKKEPLDVMKLFKPFAIAVVLCWWYPPSDTGIGRGSEWCFLDFLAYIPNAIGSYTHDLYEAEAAQVQDKFDECSDLLAQRDEESTKLLSKIFAAKTGLTATMMSDGVMSTASGEAITEQTEKTEQANTQSLVAGIMILIDKILVLLALIMYRIGWWATIYLQQIMLGVLTIFGPIHWAFSLLPKWESAWSKWTVRYISVHLIGAMLFFVGFYVMLLFDIVISIQVDQLQQILASEEALVGSLKSLLLTSTYLMTASVVSLKCLGLVPDLAAWMIPDGEAAMSARGFGEGVSSGIQQKLNPLTSRLL